MYKTFAFVLLRAKETGDLYLLGKSLQSVAETLLSQKMGCGLLFVCILSLALELAHIAGLGDLFAQSF